MGENSKIEWCTHTFNPWVGCTKLSPACDFCYAEAWAKRAGNPALWQGDRRRTTPANWRKPQAWNEAAIGSSVRPRVFCASLADVFDNQVPILWRADLWQLIKATPALDWLLLTKRPQNIRKMLPASWGDSWPNVWLGTTAESQRFYEQRYKHLSAVPAAVRFISYEPALGPLRLDWVPSPRVHKPDWLICGGESGPAARMMDPAWARLARDHCRRDGIAFFMKQMTAKAEIPADLRIRQFPEPRALAA